MNISSFGQAVVKPLAHTVRDGGIGEDVSSAAKEKHETTGVEDSRAATLKKQQNAAILQSMAEVSFKAGDEPMSLVLKSVLEGINESLQETMGENAIEKAYESGLDVTPEATANRIVAASTGFLSSFQQQNPDMSSQDMRDSFAAMINEGIDRGFAEARGVLESLSVLNGGVAENIDMTYTFVQDKLTLFLDNLADTTEMAGNKPKFRAGGDLATSIK